MQTDELKRGLLLFVELLLATAWMADDVVPMPAFVAPTTKRKATVFADGESVLKLERLHCRLWWFRRLCDRVLVFKV